MNPDTRKLIRLDLDDTASQNSIMDMLLAKKTLSRPKTVARDQRGFGGYFCLR